MSKTFVITGVTGSVGRAAARALSANKNVKLILVGRDGSKLNEVSRELQNNGTQVEVFEADLGQPDAIQRVVDRIRSAHQKIDGLVNVAAVYKGQKTLTRSGRETMFATNHLGPFALTNGLLPLIKQAPHGKVLTVSAPSSTKLDFTNLDGEKKFSALTAFGASKMMNLLMTFRLADQLKHSEAAAMAFHPGLVKSDLLKESPAFVRGLFRLISSPPERSGKAIAELMMQEQSKDQNGKFFNNKLKPMKAAAYAYDHKAQRQLWEVSERLAV
jgi:NAD(P)-dependent dehydrogenase (short-subunit alcohol dehydrogenase family)